MDKEIKKNEDKEAKKEIKNQKKKNQTAGSLILLMSIISISLIVGYITYHWIYENQNTFKVVSNNENRKSKDKEIKDDSKKTLDLLTDSFDYVIYILEGNVFCGDVDSNSTISSSSISEAPSDYILSTQFHSYNELRTYISHYMSDSLFSSHYSDEKYYLEKENKLYCGTVKLKNYSQYNPSKTEFNIIEKSDDKIVAEIMFVQDPFYQEENLTSVGSMYSSTVTFVKKEKQWVVEGIIINNCKCLDSGQGACDSSSMCKKTNTFATRYGKNEVVKSLVD